MARRDVPRGRAGVAVAGNVGRAIAGVEAPPDAWIVCELSSFQLEDVHELRPRVAVLLNLEPDHLDRHGSFEAYRDAKLRIFENQARGRHRGRAARVRRRCPARAGASSSRPTTTLPAEPGLPGAHNRENAAAATAAARAAGIADDAIAEALRTFPGVAAPAGARRRASTASASSTTRRRRTPPPRGARSRPTTSRCT